MKRFFTLFTFMLTTVTLYAQEVAANQTTSGSKVAEVLLGVLVIAVLLFVLGHMVYQNFIRKDFRTDYTVKEFTQSRKEEGLAAMSQQEVEDINRKIDSVVDLWGSIPDEHGDPFPYPLKRSVVKSTIAVIVESLAAKPTDKGTIERINDINEVLNHALVRQFTGSKAMIIVALIVGILLSIGAGQAAPIIFFGISLLFYLLASRTATFVIAAKQAKGRNSSVSFLTGLIGSLFMGVATAKTYKTVTTYSDGTTKTETDNSQTWISLIFGLVVMFILACILILISLINYIRNYLIYW